MFQQWLEDRDQENKKYYEYSTYIGAFSNPKMAEKAFKSMKESDFSISEKEFEESYNNVINDRNNQNLNQSNSISNRRRRRQRKALE